MCRGGGIGRRAGFKIRYPWMCEFDSRLRYDLPTGKSSAVALAKVDSKYLPNDLPIGKSPRRSFSEVC